MRETWSDDRFDDLNHRVDEGFRRVDGDIRALRTDTKTEFAALRGETKTEFGALRGEAKTEFAALRSETKSEFGALRGEMNARFECLETRFDSLQRTLIVFCGGIIAALIGVVASILVTGA